MRIKIDKNSWRTGYNDGYNQKPNICPSNSDSYSYSSGYIEGKADRQKEDAFKEGLNTALLSLDKTVIDEYYKKNHVSLPKDGEIYWLGVHKAISGIPNLSDSDKEKQIQSIKWLEERGYSHF